MQQNKYKFIAFTEKLNSEKREVYELMNNVF